MDWDKIHGLTHRTTGVQLTEDVGREPEPYEVSLVQKTSVRSAEDGEDGRNEGLGQKEGGEIGGVGESGDLGQKHERPGLESRLLG